MLHQFVIVDLDRLGGRTIGKQVKCRDRNETFDLGGQWVGRFVVFT